MGEKEEGVLEHGHVDEAHVHDPLNGHDKEDAGQEEIRLQPFVDFKASLQLVGPEKVVPQNAEKQESFHAQRDRRHGQVLEAVEGGAVLEDPRLPLRAGACQFVHG